MTNKEYAELLKVWLLQLDNGLTLKGSEYSTDDNRFHNFDLAVQLLKPIGVIDTPAKAAWAFRVKHAVSLIDLLNGKENVTKELIDEKLGDDAAYSMLLRGLLYRQYGVKGDADMGKHKKSLPLVEGSTKSQHKEYKY